jgi:nicotinamide mononucleotide transporter
MFLGITYMEWAANITTAVCIFLAGRNNVHTWWTGIVACIFFGIFFFDLKLYADVTLQGFFIVTGFIGWYYWLKKTSITKVTPITFARKDTIITMTLAAIVVAIGYGYLLHRFTDASIPFLDALVLTLSVIAQLLLMRRQVQTWPLWLLVNTISVPMYLYKEAYVTAAMYSLFWINAIVSWRHWLDLMDDGKADTSPAGIAAIKKEIWG